mgnify:CR=1 FL=1
MISLSQVRAGTKILFREIPHEVIQANHIKMGRSQAKLDTKLRNLLTQAIFDHTFSGNDRLEEAALSYQAATFLYRDGQQAVVMVNDTFEQLSVQLSADRFRFLSDGQAVDLLFFKDQVIDVKLPKKVTLEVRYTEPADRGNTVNTALKPAELASGATIQVPLFIKTGDNIIINSETGQYDSRA